MKSTTNSPDRPVVTAQDCLVLEPGAPVTEASPPNWEAMSGPEDLEKCLRLIGAVLRTPESMKAWLENAGSYRVVLIQDHFPGGDTVLSAIWKTRERGDPFKNASVVTQFLRSRAYNFGGVLRYNPSNEVVSVSMGYTYE